MQLKHWPTHLLRHAVVRLGLEDNLYVTVWEPTTESSEAAPARAWRSADISAWLPQVGLPTVDVRQHPREVGRLAPWGNHPSPAHDRSACASSRLLDPQPHRLAL